MRNEVKYLKLPFKSLGINIPQAETMEKKSAYGTYTYTKTYGGFVAELVEKNVIAITIYELSEDNEPEEQYRVFIGDYEYVSQRYDKNKLEFIRSTAKISSYRDKTYFNWYCPRQYICDEENRTIILNFLKSYNNEEPDVLKRITKYLDAIGERQLKEKNDRIRRSIDDAMLQIKEIPKGFDKWINDIVFKEYRYLIYKYTGKKKQNGFCSNCENHVMVTDARNKHIGECPICKSKVTFIAYGRCRIDPIHKKVSYIQIGTKGELIFRTFEAVRDFRIYGYELKKTDRWDEMSRYFLFKNEAYKFRDGSDGKSRWYKDHYYYYNHNDDGYLYYKNLKNVFKNKYNSHKHLKYIPFNTLLKNVSDINAVDFYKNTLLYPQLEYLAKLRLYKLSEELINGELPRKLKEKISMNPLTALGLRKQDIKFAQKYNMGCGEIELFIKCRDKHLKEFPYLLSMLDKRTYSYTEDFLFMLNYASTETIRQYLKEQSRYLQEKSNYSYCSEKYLEELTLGDWKDYINNCIKLGWNLRDTKVLKPKNLKERHDIAAELIKINKFNTKQAREVYYSNIFDLFYTDGKYTVTMPSRIYDLKYEGDNMHHCVYTNYAEDHINGDSIIIFIRKNNTFYKPLATAEIDPESHEVVQIRAENNNPVDKEVSAFFEKYKKNKLGKLKERMSE